MATISQFNSFRIDINFYNYLPKGISSKESTAIQLFDWFSKESPTFFIITFSSKGVLLEILIEFHIDDIPKFNSFFI